MDNVFIFCLGNCFSGTEDVLHLIQANNLILKVSFLAFIFFPQYSRNFYVTMAVQKWCTSQCCGIKPPFILYNRMTFNAPSLCGLNLLCLHCLGILLGQSWYPNNFLNICCPYWQSCLRTFFFFLCMFRVLVKNQEILSPKIQHLNLICQRPKKVQWFKRKEKILGKMNLWVSASEVLLIQRSDYGDK